MVDLLQLQSSVKSAGARLIAVSKTHSTSEIKTVYDQGVRDFGENKVQELLEKAPELPNDIQWHLIGHLQTNKVKYIVPFVHLIHTVDSRKLLKEIQKQAAQIDRTIQVLFQFHIAREDSKFGIHPDQMDWLQEFNPVDYPNIHPRGVMGMATFTDEEALIRKEFRSLIDIFRKLKEAPFCHQDGFSEISMGMSSDYQIALEEGATMVRIGSLIFGARDYSTQ
ncbi:MAG: YggS family pyridoxal phosphate-dependent enzyme [Saprospiraceae bacterium]|nr:YggS family pyridoxal phosphate-dependent enzyme [Saprospiraceae bacterium]